MESVSCYGEADTVQGHPLVTVLMPVYNAERFLSAAIESILAQTCSRFELLMLDDGSTDRSRHLMEMIADSRVKISSRDHQGLTATRNELLEWASCEYVALMDADDVSLPNRLEQQLAFLRAHPVVGAVGTGVEYINDDGLVVPGGPQLPCTDSAIRLRSLHMNCFINGSMMFRRTAASGLRYRDLAPVEDYDFWLRLSDRCTVANIPQPLYRYRIHPASTTHHTAQSKREWLLRRIRQLAVQRLLTGGDELDCPFAPSVKRIPFRLPITRSTEAYATLCAWMIRALVSGRFRLASRLAYAAACDRQQDRRRLARIAKKVFMEQVRMTLGSTVPSRLIRYFFDLHRIPTEA